MFDQAFEIIEDVRWKETGCTTELDQSGLRNGVVLEMV